MQDTGQGKNLPDPVLSLTTRVVVQVVDGETGVCFGASSDAPNVAKRHATLFKAKAQ